MQQLNAAQQIHSLFGIPFFTEGQAFTNRNKKHVSREKAKARRQMATASKRANRK